MTLLGPSGSGKTTLLILIAGFAQPSSGHILPSERDITGLPPEQRGFGMVFQGYALFPRMTAAGNLAFPLRLRKRSRAEIEHAVDRMLDLIRLPGLGQRMPAELSGGQQRVACSPLRCPRMSCWSRCLSPAGPPLRCPAISGTAYRTT